MLGFKRQPHGVVSQHCKTAVQKTRSQGCRNEFSTCSFLCDLFAFSRRSTTAARHTRLLQDTQGVRTTDVKVRQPNICLTTAARLTQGNRAIFRKAAKRMPRNTRLQCGTRMTYRETHACSAGHQGQLLEGVECHIYLYCFTFDDINLNRAFVIFVLFPKKI